jgi:uncharacterized protein (TIGR03435 family)
VNLPPERIPSRGQRIPWRFAILAGLLGVAPCAVLAQSTTRPTGFDVASIRPNFTGVNNHSSLSRSGGRITLDNLSLRECIAFAYDIPTGRDYELSGPGWLDAAKFDIVATFPPEHSRDQVREMLQTLLIERFELKTHIESKKFDAFALVVGKSGPKLGTESTETDGAFIYGEDHLTARGISTSALADRLSGPIFKLGRPVVDMTGIKGSYDFTLNWAPDDASANGILKASIFTALQEQLGLRLTPRKIAFRILVVDHADREPAGN